MGAGRARKEASFLGGRAGIPGNLESTLEPFQLISHDPLRRTEIAESFHGEAACSPEASLSHVQ